MAESGQQIRSERDALDTLTPVEIWLRKIRHAEKCQEEWRKDAAEAQEQYECERAQKGQFNILHANIEVQSTALYNSTPEPDVRRRFGDKDPVARLVGEVMERSISYQVDLYDFDIQMKGVLRQSLVVGRGSARIMFEPIIGMHADPMTGQQTEGIIGREVKCRLVPWDKWGHGPGRTWDEIPFVYFMHNLTEEEVAGLLQGSENTQERLDKLGFDTPKKAEHRREDEESDRGILKTTCVYEIWDKASKRILFIAEDDTDEPIAVRPNDLDLPGFFPIPRPLQFKHRVDSLTPIVPYKIYKHLIAELDRLNERIFKIINTLRVRGLVDPKVAQAMQNLALLDDGEYEVADAAEMRSLITGSGMKLDDYITHMPIEPQIVVLQQLYLAREQVKALIYEATGISDIIRGSVDPREKLGQSQIKAQAGSQRLEDARNEVARYARDLYRLMADVIAAQFKEQELAEITGLPQTEEDQQLWPQAMQIIKNDRLRAYKIDIETDSTLRADTQRTQELMNVFLGATAQFGQAALQLGQMAPPVIPALIATYLAFTRKMPLGKRAEDALESLEQMAPQLVEMQQQAAQETRDFEMQKMESEHANQRQLKVIEVNGKLRQEFEKSRMGAGQQAATQAANQDFEREKMDRDDMNKTEDRAVQREKQMGTANANG